MSTEQKEERSQKVHRLWRKFSKDFNAAFHNMTITPEERSAEMKRTYARIKRIRPFMVRCGILHPSSLKD